MLGHRLILLLYFILAFSTLRGAEVDSLLIILDDAIDQRLAYRQIKEKRIDSIKLLLSGQQNVRERYEIQSLLISEYQSFNCDSALAYIDRNLTIANRLDDLSWLAESKLRQSFVLSMSGFFTQALSVFREIDYDSLPHHLKVLYAWSYIRYHENLIKYTDFEPYDRQHEDEIKVCRNKLMMLLDENSDTYLKERAFRLQGEGQLSESAEIQRALFEKVKKSTHSYAMAAMGLATVYHEMGQENRAREYLVLAAITDVNLAIKENESLLRLAIDLHDQGDVDRAYNYIQAALDDANFYNSRFRNAVIARIQPIIETTYLAKIADQQKNLRMYAVLVSFFAIVLVLTLYFLYRQIRTVSQAKKKLNFTNQQLLSVNQRLDEANLIRERYIGYYINQCAIYLDKLFDFRKTVERKFKSGQLDDLRNLVSGSANQEDDARELYRDFDHAFLEVYPDFVVQLNALLKEEARYDLKKDQLNTELRIFALMRLGISDVSQIASFLRYSVQTIYNYRSKVRQKAVIDPDLFEEKVKKMGSISQNTL